MWVLYPGRIGIWRCWFLWRDENRRTQKKNPRSKARTNYKLDTQNDTGPESNLGHTDGRRVLSPLQHPCLTWSPKYRRSTTNKPKNRCLRTVSKIHSHFKCSFNSIRDIRSRGFLPNRNGWSVKLKIRFRISR